MNPVCTLCDNQFFLSPADDSKEVEAEVRQFAQAAKI